MEPNSNKKTRLEKLEQKLYARNPDIVRKGRTDLREKEYNLENSWKHEDQVPETEPEKPTLGLAPEKKKGFFGMILIFAGLFFLASVAYAGFVFLTGNQNISGDDVEINIVGPVSIGGGEELSLDVIIQNNNPVPLEIVDLVVEYPEGTKSAEDLITDLRRTREGIGDIPSGSVTRESISAALFGEEGSNKQIQVGIEYRIPGSNAVFDKKKVFEVSLNASPIRITTSGNTEISSGQTIEFEYKIVSNSSNELENLMVIADYPFGFDFERADVRPTFGENIWVFDSLKPNEEKIVKITGQVTGQNEEERIFRFNAGLQSDSEREELGIIFTNVIYDVLVQKPFVDLAMTINGSKNSVIGIGSGENIKSEILFSNNTNDVLRDVQIEVKLNGSVFDESTVSAVGGFYRSSDNTIIFNRSDFSDLEEIAPRDQVKLAFSFKMLDLKKINTSIQNPEIKISTKVSGERLSDDPRENEISEVSLRTIKVLSDTLVNAFTLSSTGPFSNTGPLPPVVETETTYTITWSVSNNTNGLEDAKVTATLPAYVGWSNQISPSSENITYDPGSRQVIWDLTSVAPGVGFLGQARDVSFKLNILPSVSQVGTSPALLRNTKFSATDSFVGVEIQKVVNDVNTALADSVIDNHQYVVE